MSIVSSVQFELCRQRKALEEALEAKDWPLVQTLDKQVAKLMQQAAEDPQRDPMVLLGELGKILSLYRRLVEHTQSGVAELSLLSRP